MIAEIKKIPQPFDSFNFVYKVLVWSGFYKPLKKPSNRFWFCFYYLRRLLTASIVIFTNVGHVLFILTSDDNHAVFETIVIEIPQINLIVKFLTMNLQSPKIDRLNEAMNGQYFGVKNEKDEEYLNENINVMNRLSKVLNIGLSVGCIMWIYSFVGKRLQNGNSAVPLHLPIDSTRWLGYMILVLLETLPAIYVAYGHIGFDTVIATYYGQALVQLKILKFNLEHLLSDADGDTDTNNYETIYRDISDTTLKKRFEYYVKKYDRIVWYTKEVNTIFNFAMAFQFFTAAGCWCFLIYTMSLATDRLSVDFIFKVLMFFIFQTQVFLYCYFGSLVEFESQSVCTAAYMSDWLTLSPQFRRKMLIAMTRWTMPLRTRVFVVVPLSLSTMVTILRSAYTLFTVMSETNMKTRNN